LKKKKQKLYYTKNNKAISGLYSSRHYAVCQSYVTRQEEKPTLVYLDVRFETFFASLFTTLIRNR